RPAVLALALCAAVAILFTSLTGLGAIIMVGSIVLPIMLTIGVPRKTAATLFMLAFALGFIFNIAQWTFYTNTFGVERAQMQSYAFVLAGVDLAALLAFAAVRFRATRGYATWAVAAEEPLARKRAPWYALATPVLPIVLYFAAGLSPLVAFVLAALYGALATEPRKSVATLTAALIRGTEDVAPAIVLFMGIGMLLIATGLPSVREALAPLVSAVAPRSWPGYVVLFGLLSPLALYRGPLNPFGVGIAVYTVLASLGVLPAVTLVAAIMAVVQVQNVCDPTNTQNVWVANFTGVGVDEIAKLTLPFQIAVATIATVAVVLFGARLLGAQPFRLGTPASAQSVASPGIEISGGFTPGLFAPGSARDAVAVAPADAGDASSQAAEQIRQRIAHDGYLRVATDADVVHAKATDCARKPFAAIVRVAATSSDVGLALSDCADWPVDEWFVPRSADVRADALAAFLRMQTWRLENEEAAEHLFATGLVYVRFHQPPTFFYSLFKTNDGQMRAYVRPGGGAYVAGLRTNDIVEKLDGKFWWEYGTFQTQARAYDGRSHSFLVKRGDLELAIVLRDPFFTCDKLDTACVPSRSPSPAPSP
ncbi:MAG: hypothetical protein IAI49_07910, partial [Candidatus Eremiobacteraeota bacterium]|nr:hypothetical protein [Candidatus Eremiobacteraeota bacterium]